MKTLKITVTVLRIGKLGRDLHGVRVDDDTGVWEDGPFTRPELDAFIRGVESGASFLDGEVEVIRPWSGPVVHRPVTSP